MDTAYQDAATAIRQLQNRPPAEPFDDLKRRPKNFRVSPEYRKWEADLRHWQTQYAHLLRDGLQTLSESNIAGVSFYHDPISNACFERQADGSIIWNGHPADNAQPLDLPGPRQDTKNFQHANQDQSETAGKWKLWLRFDQYLMSAGLHPNQSDCPAQTRDRSYIDKPIQRQIEDRLDVLELQLIRNAAALLLPEPLRLLRRAAPGVKPNLRHYNLAALAADALQRTAVTNPGAAAWFIYRYGAPAGRNSDNPRPPVPSHPGEIVAFVKAEFETNGGLRWRMLAAQPARDVISQLDTHGPAKTAFIANALADAAIPKLPDPPAKPAKPPKPQAIQQSMFGIRPEPTPEPKPKPPPPKPTTRYQQPPLPFKIALLELCDRGHSIIARSQRRNNLGLTDNRRLTMPDDTQPLERALLRFCRLAIRRYGAEPPPRRGTNIELQRNYIGRMASIADFVHAEPEAAARCTTWNGLLKASQRWHGAAVVRAIAEAERIRKQEDAEAVTPWPSAIETHHGQIWHARALVTAVDLSRESVMLKHCVGSGGYANQCRNGRSRIFHLQPNGIADDDVAAQHRSATTLELGLDQNGWYIRQHKGYKNRKANLVEDQWAKELLDAWNKAIRQQESVEADEPQMAADC